MWAHGDRGRQDDRGQQQDVIPGSYLGSKVKTSLAQLILGGCRGPDSCNLLDGIILITRTTLQEGTNHLHATYDVISQICLHGKMVG